MATIVPSLDMPHSRRARGRLAHDLRTLARDAEQLLEATAEDVSDKARDARKRLSATIEHVKEACEDLQERAVDAAITAAKQTDHAVRTHPYESVGIAFGAGFLLAWFLRRR